jgi:hypothetical protein
MLRLPVSTINSNCRTSLTNHLSRLLQGQDKSVIPSRGSPYVSPIPHVYRVVSDYIFSMVKGYFDF